MKKYILLIFSFCLSLVSFETFAQQSVVATAFFDEDGDGIDNNGFIIGGLTNAQLILWEDLDASGTVTGADAQHNHTEVGGVYTFDDAGAGLPDGNYILQFIETPWTVPAVGVHAITLLNVGAAATDNDVDPIAGTSAAFNVSGGAMEMDIDLGLYFATAIGDFVWEDLNGNGLQDGGEPGIDGILVTLLDGSGGAAVDTDGVPVPTQNTAGGGNYVFGNLPQGDYIVQFSLPTIGGLDWYATTFDGTDPDFSNDSDADPTNSFQSPVYTTEDTPDGINIIYNENIDAGFWAGSTIGDLVFCDRNGNGIYEPGGANPESGVQDMGVQIVDAAGVVVNDANGTPLTTSTDALGNYMFNLVPPGDLRVQFLFNGTLADPPYDFTLYEDPNGLGDNTIDSNAEPNDVSPLYGMTELISVVSRDPDHEMDWDAGIYKPFLIAGIVWLDQGGDNMNTGEDGPGGVLVELFQDGNKIDDVLTNQGVYEFIVPPGTGYQIQIGADNFLGGAPLAGVSSCPGSSPAGDMVDNNDNGPDTDPGDVITTSFDLIADCIDNSDVIIEYIDFCFAFECDQPNILASTACDDIPEANFICDVATLGTFCAIMPTPNSPGNQPQPLCPDGGTAHNITWFAFVAYDGNYDITLTPTGCTGDDPGVQIGLYTDCTFTEEVFCNSGCSTTAVSIPSSALTPGQTYYWFIDGCFGSVCSYEVDIVGTAIPPNLVPTDMCIFDTGTSTLICDDATYCPNTDVTFQVQGLELTVDFTWSITTLLDGPYTGDNMPTSTDDELIVSFVNEGVYRVCIENINNGCQFWSGPALCRDITIAGIDDEMFDEVFVCAPEDFTDPSVLVNMAAANPMDPNGDGTVGWQGGNTFVEGTNMFMVTTPQGCMYEQEFELSLFPESEVGLFEMTLCRNELPINIDGSDYTELSFAGDLVLTIPMLPLVNSTDVNGCDSIIDLNLEILDIFMGELTSGLCTPDGIILNFDYGLETDGFPSTESEFITWVWTDDMGNILDDNFNPTDPLDNMAPFGNNGTYTLTATVDKNGKQCIFEYMVDVDFDQFLPPNPEISGPGLDVCEADSIVTYTAINFGDAFNFTWTYPSDVASFTISGADGEILTLNWSGSAGGSVTLVSENSCGMSEEVEVVINVIPQPTPSFSFVTEVCVDSCTMIEFIGDATDLDFTWDFDGGVVDNGTGGTGPGPHCVYWADPGDKDITLSYTDISGCLSTITIETITVIPPIAAPTINCNPNTGEVSFTWDDIPDATFGVEVTSISTITGMLHEGVLNGTTYTVTGLDDGETVTIILTIFTNDACQMISFASPGCTSQDCIAPPIMLEADSTSFCLDENSGVATITATILSGETGTGVFSGPGIVDSINGIFDPDSAMIGINTITYIFMTDDVVPCIGNGTTQIEVNETPVASFTSDVDTICISDQFNLNYDGTSGASTYTWDYGDGGTGSGGPTPSVTFDSPGEKTIRLIVEKDNCESESVTVDLFVQPLLPEIVVNCSMQDLDEVGFSWNDIPGATGYLVSVNGNAPFETTNTTYNESGLSPNDVVTITVTVLTDSKCPGSMDSAECIATSCPDFVISFDNPIPDLCVDGTNALITLEASAAGGTGLGDFTWSGPNVTGDQFDPNGLSDGDYEIFVIYEEDSCQGDSSMMVNITASPTAAFSVDNTTICVGDTVNILYEGSQITGQTIMWTSGGEDVIDGTNPNEHIAVFNSAGMFDIQLDVMNGTCTTAPDNATITVEPELVFDTINCVEDLDQIEFSWTPVDCATEYEVFIGGVSQGTQTATSYTATGLTVGEEVMIEVIAVSGCACGNVMKTRMCEAQECTQVDINLSTMDNNTVFCASDAMTPIEIIAETLGSDGNGTFTWSGPGVDQDGMFDPVAAGVGTHTIVFDFLESAGCPFADSITFTIHENPTVAQQFEDILCFDQATTMLEVTPSGGTAPYNITLDGIVADTLNDVTAGMYDIIVTDDNMCSVMTSVTIPQPAEPMPTISGATDLIVGDSSTYSIQANLFTGTTVDSVIWSANGTVICNDAGCFSIGNQMPTETTIYEVTVHYNGGCSVTATTTVEVTEPPVIPVFIIPNIMSPNGDGENDTWQFVTNNDSIVINSVKVFDRWGNMVWTFTGPVQAITNSPVWDGKYNDVALQPGVYVYFVNFNDDRRQNRVRSGDITIIN